MTNPPKSQLFLIINGVACVGGAVAFACFAWGMQRKDSWANALLRTLVDHAAAVLIMLSVVCVAVLVPWVWQETRKREK